MSKTQIFTPPGTTNQMLDLLDSALYADEGSFFFEPSCGNGQMLEVVLDRMLASTTTKYGGDSAKAMAETITRFYAVELDPELVIACRTRIYQWCVTHCADTASFTRYLIARTLQNAIEHKDFFAAVGLNPVARKIKGRK